MLSQLHEKLWRLWMKKKILCSLVLVQLHYLIKIQTVLQWFSHSPQNDSSILITQNTLLSSVAEVLTAPAGQCNIGMWRMESVCLIKQNIKCKGFNQLWPWVGHLTSFFVYTCVKWGACCADGIHTFLPIGHLFFISFYVYTTQGGSYHFIDEGKYKRN